MPQSWPVSFGPSSTGSAGAGAAVVRRGVGLVRATGWRGVAGGFGFADDGVGVGAVRTGGAAAVADSAGGTTGASGPRLAAATGSAEFHVRLVPVTNGTEHSSTSVPNPTAAPSQPYSRANRRTVPTAAL